MGRKSDSSKRSFSTPSRSNPRRSVGFFESFYVPTRGPAPRLPPSIGDDALILRPDNFRDYLPPVRRTLITTHNPPARASARAVARFLPRMPPSLPVQAIECARRYIRRRVLASMGYLGKLGLGRGKSRRTTIRSGFHCG